MDLMFSLGNVHIYSKYRVAESNTVKWADKSGCAPGCCSALIVYLLFIVSIVNSMLLLLPNPG